MEILKFTHFPGYARFLLDNRLTEFVLKQFEYSREVEIPLLKLFAHMPEAELVELSKVSNAEILLAAAENKLHENIAIATKQWKENLVPFFTREQVVADDITLVSLIRKKGLVFFLPQYTTDLNIAIQIINEIDKYIQASEAASFETFVDIQQEKLSRANTALQQSEDLYKQAQALTHIGNWSWYIQDDKILWSDEMYRICGLQPQTEEITMEKFISLVHPDDKPMRKQQIMDSLQTMQPPDYTMRIIRPNGEIVVLQGKSEIVSKDGKPYKMMGTCQDVTSQHRLQKQLEDEKMLAETIIETSIDVIAVCDKNLQLIAMNKKFEDLFGVKREDALGQPMLKSFPQLQGTDLVEDLQKTLNGEIVHHSDRKFVGIDRHFESYFIPLKDSEGGIFAALTLTHDITDIKKATRQLTKLNTELKTTEDRYQKMILEVQDYAILRLSPEGIIENWNRGAEKIKGYHADEIVGESFSKFYLPAEVANGKPERILNLAREHGRAVDEGWRLRKDGSRFWAMVTIAALHDDAGDVVGFTKVTRDLTERKLREAELEQKSKQLVQAYNSLERNNQELSRSNKELSSFGYVASHDLQEPLRKIMMFSQMIEENERKNLSQKGQHMLDKIHAGAQSMKRLIADLLAYSKLQSNETPEELVDLNVIVAGIKEANAEIYAQQGAVIKVGALPKISGVSFQLQQLFENIIGNSLKYAREAVPPVVEITTDITSGKIVPHEGVEPNSTYYKITIADNGIGFDQQYSQKIFEIFQRLHRNEDYAGTGIGLAICKKIVQNHKGFIEAVGVPNVGATFIIYLPVINPAV
ncbi:MAG: PAS domain S-box protein [Chitinophagales bacterium]|nr:PAS domain S-box protein [Chitinophagales bacterium]